MISSEKSGELSETQELRLAAGVWLRELREAAGISQRALAESLNLDYYTFISQLENGRGRIPSNRYREWARALSVNEKVFVKKLLMFYDPISYEILFGGRARSS
jgi:transcriptional regulator with XRE-family HTH domain